MKFFFAGPGYDLIPQIREDFNEAARKWYQEIVGNWYEGGVLKKLEADKNKLIRYDEIIKTLSTKWVDIRGKDDRFTEVKLIHFSKEGKNSTIATEEGIIEMIERVKIREEEMKESKRIKEELQKHDVKRGEAMMKKQNVVLYTGKPAFY